MAFFLAAYPMDYLKTLMQTDSLDNFEYKSLRDVFIKRAKSAGFSTLYKGIGVTLIRAFFVNAGGFFAF